MAVVFPFIFAMFCLRKKKSFECVFTMFYAIYQGKPWFYLLASKNTQEENIFTFFLNMFYLGKPMDLQRKIKFVFLPMMNYDASVLCLPAGTSSFFVGVKISLCLAGSTNIFLKQPLDHCFAVLFMKGSTHCEACFKYKVLHSTYAAMLFPWGEGGVCFSLKGSTSKVCPNAKALHSYNTCFLCTSRSVPPRPFNKTKQTSPRLKKQNMAKPQKSPLERFLQPLRSEVPPPRPHGPAGVIELLSWVGLVGRVGGNLWVICMVYLVGLKPFPKTLL